MFELDGQPLTMQDLEFAASRNENQGPCGKDNRLCDCRPDHGVKYGFRVGKWFIGITRQD